MLSHPSEPGHRPDHFVRTRRIFSSNSLSRQGFIGRLLSPKHGQRRRLRGCFGYVACVRHIVASVRWNLFLHGMERDG